MADAEKDFEADIERALFAISGDKTAKMNA